MHHLEKVEKAKEAIRAVHSDTSVGNLETRDSLIELQTLVTELLDAVDADIDQTRGERT